mgnify:CR=1 FL=1
MRPSRSYVEEQIENGATLQIGIGDPNIVGAAAWRTAVKGDFGIHTEMMVDGIMRLHQAGKVTNHKGDSRRLLGVHLRRRQHRALPLDRPQSGGAHAPGRWK